MDLPVSHRVTRAPRYSGIPVTEPSTSCTGLSPTTVGLSSLVPLYNFSGFIRNPTTPKLPKQLWFGLIPVRSPLLRKSLLFSSPMGTKMFQFPTFAQMLLASVSCPRMTGYPIRISADQFVCANPRSFSQLITSFVAS